MKQPKETGPKNRVSKDLIKCKKCDKAFSRTVDLKKHHESIHGVNITQCSLCEKEFAKNSDLEIHIAFEHKESETFKCKDYDKTFVLEWRLRKHSIMHMENQRSIRFCHYFNNDKVCPFTEIGCMFQHSVAPQCKHHLKCFTKLCQFKHSDEETQSCHPCDYANDPKDNSKTHPDGLQTAKITVMTDDEFDFYVMHNYAEVHEKFSNGNRKITCYFCDYVSKCKTLMSIQEELINHLETDHADVIQAYDTDTYQFENEYQEDFLSFFVQ